MIKQLIENISPAPGEALEHISADAARLNDRVLQCRRGGNDWEFRKLWEVVSTFAESVKNREDLIGRGAVLRILSEPVPVPNHWQAMKTVWDWIDSTSQNIRREMDRRERKQLFAVAVLAPIVSAAVAGVSIMVSAIGIFVTAIMRNR